MAVGHMDGGNNFAGKLSPQTSPWGQQLRAATPRLIVQARPIGGTSDRNALHGKHGFGGTVGGIVTLAASSTTLVAPRSYNGDLPSSVQGTVSETDPWMRR